jgi:hypothetical protein
MYSLNKTKNGWLVALFNHRGLDKTQNGIARVDRTAFVDVRLWLPRPSGDATELTQPRQLFPYSIANDPESWVIVRVHPGDLQIVEIKGP